MTAQVSGFDHYDFYLDEGTVDEVKLNTTPVAEGAHFTVPNLDPGIDYSNRISAVPVDKAGNATRPGRKYTGLNVITADSTPAQALMSAQRRADLDNIVTRCIAVGAGPGVAAHVLSPFGHYELAQGDGSAGINYSFRVGSQSKSMLVHTIMMAIDQGLIGSVDDTLDMYWDGPIPYKDQITLRMMLHMRSGIYDYSTDQTLGFQYYMNPAFAITVDQVIARINAGAAAFTPDSNYQYSNSNFVLLGRIRELVDPAGRTIDQILKQDVFDPLGMADTYLQRGVGGLPAPASKANATNFILSLFGIAWPTDVTVQNADLYWTAGGVVSRLADMMAWGREMYDCTLLSPETRQILLTSFGPPLPAVPRYGFAFDGPETFLYGCGREQIGSLVTADGSILGTSSATQIEPSTGTIVSSFETFQTTAPHVLAALSTVDYEIIEYLLPNAEKQPGYGTGEDAAGTSATSLRKISTAAVGDVFAPGVFPPRDEINQFKTDAPVPKADGAAYLVINKLRGKGGRGGDGTPVYNSTGGSGGGTGAAIPAHGDEPLRIPVELLGDTYTTRINANGDAEFISGTVRLTAKGGGNGASTTSYNTTMPGGAAGTWEVVGLDDLDVTGDNGLAGAAAHMYGGGPGLSGAVKDVAGSGASGRGSYGGISGAVQPGGDSLTVPGTTGPGGDATGDNSGAGGGEGQPGGKWGGGGGGGYSYGNVAGQAGRLGGPGLVHIGWE